MNNDFNSWDKYCNYLWFDKQVNIWLDISKINFTLDQISSLENKFKNVFSALKELEAGAISNIDEKRQVGHYWLRNPSVAPNNFIKNGSILSTYEKFNPQEFSCNASVISNGPKPLPPIPIHKTLVNF